MMVSIVRQVFSKCHFQSVVLQKVAPENKHTAGNHGHAFMFFDCFLNEHQTLDCFYSTPFLKHQVHISMV